MRLRILTYNIHKGVQSLTQRDVLSQIREVIREVNPELVFLQEVRGQFIRIEEPQFEFLADQVWPYFAYGRNAVYQKGHHGNAILSLYGIQDSSNTDLSNSRLERRGLLHGVIPLEGQTRPLHVFCVHLDLFERGRKRQFDRMVDQIEATTELGDPVILAGDFNDWGQSATPFFNEKLALKEAFLECNGAHARSYPSFLPCLKLDRVYFRNLTVRSAQTFEDGHWKRLSDHLPLLVEFEL